MPLKLPYQTGVSIQTKKECTTNMQNDGIKMKKLILTLIFSGLLTGTSFSQVIVPFIKRFEVTQRGGLVLVANNMLTCNGGASCTSGQGEVPPAGSSVDNDFTSAYIDVDGDASTFSSSKADMNLPACSKVSFAGLYWGAYIDLGNAKYAQRANIKIKEPGSASYTTLTADTIYDFNTGYNVYNCFKDITDIVTAAGNGTYTMADLVSITGGSNQWAGWGIVIVYKNDLMQEKNLTVYDGVGNVNNAGSSVTASVNGFYTPPSGAVNFELGIIAYDGDRDYTGDSLLFKGAGSFIQVSDALHPVDDVFNSTISNNGVQTLTRNPAYKNTLGFDANIFKPNNAAKNYLANGATSAQIKVTTGGEQIFLQVITSAIDTYEPELRAQKTVSDVNGGGVNPGDTLLYTVSMSNSGNDTSTATSIVDTLPFNADYVPNSVRITAGPNQGAKTDAAGDDQARFDTSAGFNIITMNMGNGANAGSGGQMPHIGANSTTTFTFKVKITDDCTKLLCNPTISNRVYIDYKGYISGLSRRGSSNPLLFDSLGCPIEGFTSTSVTVPVSCSPPPDSTIGGCLPLKLDSVPSIRPGYIYYNSSWTQVTYATVAGTYYGVRSIPGVSCKDTIKYTIYQPVPTTSNAGPNQSLCNVTSTTLAGNTAAVGTGTWTRISGPNTPTITSPNSPTSTVTGMVAGTYVFQWKISVGPCASSIDSVQIIIYATPTVSNAGPDQNLCNVSSATFAGNTPVNGTGAWSLVSGPNTPSITTPSSPTSTVTGMIAGTYTFRWTISNGVCTASTNDVVITIYSLPTTSNAGANQNLCNVTSTNLSGNSPAIGSGTWTMVSGPNTPTITSSGSPNTSVTGMIAGVYTFRWSITNGVCAASTDDVQVTIYATPTVSNGGPDQNLCNVSSVTLAANTPATGTGAWSLVSGPNTPTITTAASPSSTVTGMIAGVYVFRWTISNGVCTASTNDVQITIYGLPTTSNAGSDQSLCNVTSATFAGNTPAVGNGTWSLISGPNAPTITTPSSATSTITGMIAGVYTFRWTISNGVCASSTDDVQITIYALPTASNAGPDQGLCNVTAATLAGNTAVTGSGNWTLVSGPNTPTITTASSPNTSVSGMITGVYIFRWTITNGVCASSADDVQITIYALPTVSNAGPDQSLCNVNNTTLAGNTPVTGTGNWTMVSGPNTPTITTPSNPASTVTGMVAGVYVFRWSITNGVCASSTNDVQVSIFALPTVSNAGADQNLCNVASTTLSGNTAVTGSGNWSLISGPNSPTITTPSSPSSTVTGMVPGVYILRWTISNGACASTTDDVQVTIYALPTTSNAGPDQSLCNVTTASLSGNTPAVGTGNWSLVSGPNAPTITAPGSANTSVTGMIAGVYTFMWTVTSGVCATSTDNVQITIYDLPTVSNAGPDQSLCNVTSTSMAGNAPGVGTGNWTLVSGPNTPTIVTPSSATSSVTGMITGVYTFRWTISNGVCATSSNDVQVTIYALPTVSNAGPDQSLCNVTNTTLAANTPASGTGNWTLVSGPNSPTITAPGNPASTVTGMITGVYTFRWTVSIGVCTPSTDDIQVTIYALPTVSNAGPDQSVCNVSSATLAGNTPAIGSGNWTLVSGPNTPVITTPSSPTSAITSMIPGVYVFRWTITNGVCATSTDDIQITNYALPTVSNAGADQSLCNVNNTSLAGNAPAIGTGNWTFISGPNLPVITTPSSPTSTVTGMVTGVYTFRWTITNGVCATSTDNIQVTIYALPTVANAGPDKNLCNVTSATLAGNAAAIGSGNWTLVSGPNTPVITTPSAPNSTITGMIAGVYTFRWSITNGVCAVSTDNIQITIYALPTVSNAGPDQSLCNVSSTTLAGNAPAIGTGNWALVSGPNTPTITTPSSPASTVTGMIAGIYTFRWTITNGVCAVSTNDVQVTIYDLPTVSNAGPDQDLCNVTSVTLAGNTALTGSGNWTLISGPNVPAINDTTDPNTPVNGMIAGAYTFRWTISNGVCAVSTDDIIVTIYNLPTIVDAGPDQGLCNIDTAIMAANVPGFGTGTWTLIGGPNVPTFDSLNDASSVVRGMITGIYQFGWTISNGVCSSFTDTVEITIFDLPTVSNAGPDQDVCSVTSVTLGANSPLIGTGTWTIISGPNTPVIVDSSDANTNVTGMTTGVYVLRWTILNGTCAVSDDDVQITIYNIPLFIDAGPDQSLCNIDSVTMAGNTPAIGTGTWTIISGPNSPVITSPTNPSTTITGMVAGTYVIGWTITNGVCVSPTDTMIVNIYDLPTIADAGIDQDLCDIDSTTMAANTASTGNGNWLLVSGPNTPVIADTTSELTSVTGMIAGTYLFSWNISNGVCSITSDTVRIRVYDLPTVADAGADQSLCNVNSIVMTANTATTGAGNWTLVSGPNTPSITDVTDPSTSVTGMIPGIYQFAWTISNGVCSVTSDTVEFTLYALPTVSNAGPDQNLCNTYDTFLGGNIPVDGSGMWTQVSGPNMPTIAVPNNAGSPVSGFIQGTYEFVWTITNGVCAVSTDTVKINVFDLPTVANAGTDQYLCADTMITLAGNAALNGTGMWTFSSGPNVPVITTPGDSNSTVSGIIPGTYVFHWSITSGTCAVSVDSVSFVIYQYPPVVDGGADQILCNVSSVSLAGNNPVSGTGLWSTISGPNTPVISSPSSPSTSVTGMIAGTYLFGWSITNGVCFSYTDTMLVTIYDLPTVADAGPDQNLCNADSIVMAGNAASTGNGNWTFISGPNTPVITDTTNATTSVTGMTQGTYLFSWTISNGVCAISTDTVQITIYNLILISNAGPDQHLCNTDSSVMAGNAPSAGLGTWTLISGPNAPVITNPNDSATSITGMVAGSYVFGWTINNGVCVTPTDEVLVTIDDLPTVADAGIDQLLCNDTSTVLSGNLPSTGNGVWTLVSGPNAPTILSPNSASTNVDGLAAGTYLFAWTISNGVCSASSDTVMITMYNLPTVADAGADQYICNADSAVMTANVATTGASAWTFVSGPNTPVITDTTNATTSVTGMIAGTYLFAWTINNGVCSATTDTVQITIYDLPTVANAGGDQDLCNGGIATMTANAPVTGNGTWTLVSGPNIPTITSVSNPATTITGMIRGTYLFCWSIANGVCSTSYDTVEVKMEDILVPANAGTDQQLCNTTFTLVTTTLNGSVPSGGSGTWTLMSGPNTPFIFSPSSPSTLVSGLADGLYVFRWTIVNGVCTPTSDDVNISVYTVPAISYAGADQSLCHSDSTTMLADSSLTGIGTWSIISSPNTPNIQSPNSPTSLITGLVPGTYQFGWTYTNGVCTSLTDTVQIIVFDYPTMSAAGPDQDLCLDTTTTMAANTPSIGNGSWSLVSGPSSVSFVNITSPVTAVNGLVPGVYTLRWTIMNGPCDSSADDVQVRVSALPLQTSAGIDQSLCGATSALLEATLPAIGNGTWSLISGPNIPVIACTTCASTQVDSMITGIYIFRWTISSGTCPSVSDDIQVSIFDNPAPTYAGLDQVICDGDSAVLTGRAASVGTGQWSVVSSPGSPLIISPDSISTTVTQLIPGSYVFRWTVTNGICSQSDDVSITVNASPVISVTASHVYICIGDQVALTASGASSYSWTPAASLNDPWIASPLASPTQNTTYVVAGTDQYGCIGKDSVRVLLCDTVIIPDGFSPDDNGVNDYFEIVGIQNYPDNVLHVYNRWGNIIYEKHKYDNTWSGISNVGGIRVGTGKVPAGTYYYVLELGENQPLRSGYIIIRY